MKSLGAINFSREELIAEAWQRGRLDYKLHAAQRVLNDTFKSAGGNLFIANCSRQWGKSFWAVKTAVEFALKNPKAQIRYGAAFQTDLEEFILPAFDKILEDCPEELRPKYNAQKSVFIFKNQARIKLVGVDKKPDGLRGNTLDMIIGDEVGFWSDLDYIYTSIIVPSTLHRPNCKIIFISTPPATPAHAFTDYCQKAELAGSYVKLDIHTNPLITPDDIKRMADELGGETSTAFRRECLCEFVTEADLAIVPEWDDKYIEDVPRDEFYPYYHKYDAMDLGVKDLTAILYAHYDFKRACLIVEDEDELSGAQMNTAILVGKIRAKEKELWDNLDEQGKPKRDPNNQLVPFRRIADNNWPLLILDLSSIHSLPFISTDKDVLEAMINELRLWVQAGRLRVHPRCKKLIGCLKYGVWDEKKKQFARSKVYGHFDHLAALVYLVRNVVTGANPIPKNHGFENHTAWLGNIKGHEISSNARILQKTLFPKTSQISTSNRKKRGPF